MGFLEVFGVLSGAYRGIMVKTSNTEPALRKGQGKLYLLVIWVLGWLVSTESANQIFQDLKV